MKPSNKIILKAFKDRLQTFFAKIEVLYNNDIEFTYVKKTISMIESELSANKDFFKEKHDIARDQKMKKLIKSMTVANDDVFDFVTAEYSSPLGLFADLLDSKIPDVAISNVLIKVQFDSQDFEDIHVPKNLQDSFQFFLKHLVNNIKFMNDKKFDMVNAIIDAEYNVFRFNIIHESLNSNKSEILTIRKHIQGVKSNNSQLSNEQYEESLGVSDNVVELIRNYSGKSVCIFGETGSGKTTMLRFLTNYKLEEKRNLCIIEDTPELRVLANISLVTNKDHTIKDLFTTALRLNPSHIVVGETRTDEIVDIMEAGLTISTSTSIHANTFQKALERIYFMSRPRGLNKEDITSLISASIEMFIFMENRKVAGVWVRNEELDGDISNKYNKIELV